MWSGGISSKDCQLTRTMTHTLLIIIVAVAALLHALFMLCELFSWSSPILLRLATKSQKLPTGPALDATHRDRVAAATALPPDQAWTAPQAQLVATIVHNAGIYDAIVAGGLAWAVLSDPLNLDVARVLLAGAALAGVFGTITMPSLPPVLQALIGLAGLAISWFVPAS